MLIRKHRESAHTLERAIEREDLARRVQATHAYSTSAHSSSSSSSKVLQFRYIGTWHAQKNKMGGRAPRRVWTVEAATKITEAPNHLPYEVALRRDLQARLAPMDGGWRRCAGVSSEVRKRVYTCVSWL